MSDNETAKDEKRLKPAQENPWYVLATVHGEQELNNPPSSYSVAENRRIWNGWACQDLSDDEREKLAETMGLEPADLDRSRVRRAPGA